MASDVSLIDLQRLAPKVCLRTIQRVLSALEIRAPFGDEAKRVVVAMQCWHDVMGVPRQYGRACMMRVLAEVKRRERGVVIWDGSRVSWQDQIPETIDGRFVVHVEVP